MLGWEPAEVNGIIEGDFREAKNQSIHGSAEKQKRIPATTKGKSP
jgi:hypothetical protein